MTVTTLLLLAALAGLVIGSFCNVVIHRLPLMMTRDWAEECAHYLREQAGADAAPETATPAAPRLSLSHPRSHCPHCHTPLRWHQLVPLLSWVLQRGRCGHCRAPVSLRYPLVELAVALLAVSQVALLGASATALAGFSLLTLLLVAGIIDWNSQWLPDRLTLLLLWLGIIAASLGAQPLQLGLQGAVWGAICGWLFLAVIAGVFKRVTGKDGLGGGDSKLLAALGAWLGPLWLPQLLLVAALLGLLTALWQRLRHRQGGAFPFGPALALSGALIYWQQLLPH